MPSNASNGEHCGYKQREGNGNLTSYSFQCKQRYLCMGEWTWQHSCGTFIGLLSSVEAIKQRHGPDGGLSNPTVVNTCETFQQMYKREEDLPWAT